METDGSVLVTAIGELTFVRRFEKASYAAKMTVTGSPDRIDVAYPVTVK
jgi:hypothetical protein